MARIIRASRPARTGPAAKVWRPAAVQRARPVTVATGGVTVTPGHSRSRCPRVSLGSAPGASSPPAPPVGAYSGGGGGAGLCG
jgi:hypothetical protein